MRLVGTGTIRVQFCRGDDSRLFPSLDSGKVVIHGDRPAFRHAGNEIDIYTATFLKSEHVFSCARLESVGNSAGKMFNPPLNSAASPLACPQ